MESNNNDDLFPITVITKSDEFVVVDARTNMKIKFLKWKIHMLKKIEPKHQRLFFEGLELEEPDLELSNYGIEPLIDEDGKRQNMEFTIYLVEFYQGIPQTYFLDEAQYDPKWNCSYEGIITQRRPIRGGKSYIQPIGCVRYGLKVLGKYENDIWLGGKGYRTDNEWPVAYHGTNELNVLEILQKGFLIEKGKRFAYGKGIYCSPDPNVALGYAFHYPFEGKIYKLIIQCRVDPSKLQIHGNYWLVTEEKQIRPYAICVFSEDRVTELQAHLKKIGIQNDHGFQWGSQGGYSQPPPGTIYANSVPLPPPIRPALIKPNTGNAPKSDKSSKSNSTDSANQ